MRRMTREEQKVSQWSGGETKQLFIWPVDGDYAARRFAWRISTATVEVEESDFSDLTGFERWIMTVDGSMVLFHGKNETSPVDEDSKVILEPYQPYRFDGGLKTKSKGLVRDFNLMTGEGWQGKLIPLRDITDYHGLLEMPYCHLFIHCLDGKVEIENENNREIITKDDSLYLKSDGTIESIDLKSTDGNAFSVVLCMVWRLT